MDRHRHPVFTRQTPTQGRSKKQWSDNLNCFAIDWPRMAVIRSKEGLGGGLCPAMLWAK